MTLLKITHEARESMLAQDEAAREKEKRRQAAIRAEQAERLVSKQHDRSAAALKERAQIRARHQAALAADVKLTEALDVHREVMLQISIEGRNTADREVRGLSRDRARGLGNLNAIRQRIRDCEAALVSFKRDEVEAMLAVEALTNNLTGAAADRDRIKSLAAGGNEKARLGLEAAWNASRDAWAAAGRNWRKKNRNRDLKNEAKLALGIA